MKSACLKARNDNFIVKYGTYIASADRYDLVKKSLFCMFENIIYLQCIGLRIIVYI